MYCYVDHILKMLEVIKNSDDSLYSCDSVLVHFECALLTFVLSYFYYLSLEIYVVLWMK